MSSMRFPAAFLFLVLLGLNLSLAQNQPDKAPDSGTVLKTTTRLVVVDVVVTNAKGEPVADLKNQDFKIRENGKEQDVRVFEFQHPVQQPAETAARRAKLPPNTFTNIPAYKPSSALNIVLLDLLNTAAPRQNFARDELTRFLQKLPPGTPFAIYVLADKLRLVQDFTDDPQVLLAAAGRLQNRSSALLDNSAGGPAMVVPLPNGAPLAAAVRGKEAEAREFTTAEQVELTLAALSSLAQRLAPYPGRKNLIWISDGFPFYINPRSANLSNTRGQYKQAAYKADTVLMDSQVAIYPVDAHAVQVPSMDDIGYGKIYGHDVDPLAVMSKDFGERLAVHSTMNELAEETGGEAFYNNNSIQTALRRGSGDGSTYYTLGYYPQDKHWDGKFRKIEVAVNRPGVKLRYRLGYYALEPTGSRQKSGLTLHDAMDVNSPVSSALQFQALVMGPSEKTKNKVVVNFGVDPRAVSFEKSADGLHHAVVECAVEAYSTKGTVVKSEATTVNAALQPEVFAHVMQTFFPCQQMLDLPAGSYALRLGVVDDHTGLMGTANGSVIVPEQSADKSGH